ncbi:MAG: sigma-70 family RNA polymerase sigma factor [Steroidobacteraceae bacterium]
MGTYAKGSEKIQKNSSNTWCDIPIGLDSIRGTDQNALKAVVADRQLIGSGLPASPIDELITSWRSGDEAALQALLPLIYEELHRIASRHLRAERADHTLQATALIHEAYLRLVGGEGAEVRDRCHFVALASRLMRQVLVDHARGRLAAKRQGGIRVTLSEALDLGTQPEIDLLAVDDALVRLALLDVQQAQVVELRFFGGLSIVETSDALRVSEATVKRDWTTARAWLRRELERAQRS